MGKIIKSALYKLFKDWTFRITLIVGTALALFMALIYLGIDCISGKECIGDMCNGYMFYTSSLSPTQNFGLTVPINLIVFTIGEFTCGTIRNKIVAGNKKTLIYISLVITGIIFTIALMAIYFGLTVAFGSIIGGFKGLNPNIEVKLLYQYPIIGLTTYLFIVAFTIFVATSIRNLGGAMPIVIITIVFLYFLAFVPSIQAILSSLGDEIVEPKLVQAYLNPLYGFGNLGITGVGVGSALNVKQFIGAIVTPIYWAAIFVVLGIVVFNKKDVK